MKPETLFEAIGDIRTDFVLEAEQGRKGLPRRKAILAACLAVLLIVIPLQAQASTGYVSNLLAPLYGAAQVELVEDIGVPIDATAEIGDYLLSADAVIGDRYNLAIVYSLTRKDGGPVADTIRFKEYSNDLKRTGGSLLSYKPSPDGAKLHIIEQRNCADPLFFLDRTVSAAFTDLLLSDKEGSPVLVEGTWSLCFAARYRDTTVTIPSGNRTVMGSQGNRYRIQKIRISPVGVHIDFTAPNPYADGGTDLWLMPDFTVSLLLSDGTQVELKDANRALRGNSKKPTHKADFSVLFETPISLRDIQALVICGTAFPANR